MGGCAAILLAAGSSRRLGFDKIMTPLAGCPGILYSVEVLAQHPAVKELILVTRPDLEEPLQELISPVCGKQEWKIIYGGKERQDSVYAGLQAISGGTEFALIHDGARPLLTPALMDSILDVAMKTGAAICGRPCADTLKETEDHATVSGTPDRSRLWQVETPQVFRRDWITEAYRTVIETGASVTDDASALERTGRTVSLVESRGLNLKLTRPQDWEILEFWLSKDGGGELRKRLHEVNNSLMPLTGYLPFLKKYREDAGRFEKYADSVEQGSRRAVSALHAAQVLARKLFPYETDGH